MEGSNYDCAVVMILISLFFFLKITRSRDHENCLPGLFGCSFMAP